MKPVAPDLPPLPPVPGSVATAKPVQVLTSVGCGSCGGSLTVEEGTTNLVCSYCGTPVLVVGERGVARRMVLDSVDRDGARDRILQWFKSGIRKDPTLKREARVEEAFLAWFPFIRHRFDAVGWVLGYVSRRRKRGNRWETVSEPVERQVERSLDLTTPTSDMGEFGVDRIDLHGDEVLPLDLERLRARGMVFRPVRSAREQAAVLEQRALDQLIAESQPDRVTFRWLEAARRQTTLVYYPLWVVRYRFRERLYQVLVDAEDGAIAWGKAPGNHFYRAACLVAACGGAAFIATTVLQHLDWVTRGEGGLGALALIGLLLLAIIRWGYSQFRYGGVIEEGTGVAARRGWTSLGDAVRKAVGSR